MNPTEESPLPDPLLPMEAICRWLGIRKRTLQTWRQSGKFPQPDLEMGKTLRWRPATVQTWLDRQQRTDSGWRAN